MDLRTAALQFALFPKVAAALIPGARTPEQVAQNVASLKEKIPDAFWQQLKAEKLIEENAPVMKVSANSQLQSGEFAVYCVVFMGSLPVS